LLLRRDTAVLSPDGGVGLGDQSVHARVTEAKAFTDLLIAVAGDLQRLRQPPPLRHGSEKVQRRPQFPAERHRVTGIDRLVEELLLPRHLEADVRRLRGVQSPCLALGGLDEPGAPVAVAIRLVANELRPREVAGIVDDVRRRPDEMLDDACELPVVAPEQLGLIASERRRTCWVVRSVVRRAFWRGIGPRIGARRASSAFGGTADMPVCRAF
jgi:hypothetical protein